MNTDYVWAGSLYRTRAEMLVAIAAAYATSWGRNSQDEVLRIFQRMNDAELAEEAIDAWGLDCGEDEPHTVRFGYTAADLAAAFGRVRERLGARHPAVPAPG